MGDLGTHLPAAHFQIGSDYEALLPFEFRVLGHYLYSLGVEKKYMPPKSGHPSRAVTQVDASRRPVLL